MKNLTKPLLSETIIESGPKKSSPIKKLPLKGGRVGLVQRNVVKLKLAKEKLLKNSHSQRFL